MRISEAEIDQINTVIRSAERAINNAKNMIEQRDERIQFLEKQIEFLQKQNLSLIEQLGSKPA
jgi:hypothetical protein